MLPHTYKRVFGFFDFEHLYTAMVATAPRGATLVELGVYLGRSACFLAVEAHNADRGLRTVHIDNFVPMPRYMPCWTVAHAKSPDGTLYEPARAALQATGAAGWELWKADQLEAAARFADGSCWAVWVDTDHEYATTLAALRAWWPRVQPGGWFGGHDYGHPKFPGVTKAVEQWAREAGVQITAASGSWWLRRPQP